MDEQFQSFGEFFRTTLVPELIKHVDPAMDHLRQTNPHEWLQIAMQLRRRGSYDRLEQQNAERDALTMLIELIAKGLAEVVPEYVKLHNEAMEQHYVQHGLELDDLMRRHPNAEPMSAKDAVDAQLRAMGINIKPDDPR